MNFKDAAQGLSEAVHQFVVATVRELDGKQTEAQAIETARGALHRVADAAADQELEGLRFYAEFVEFFRGEGSEGPGGR